jgi:aerobic carbon-monoxide dehydrogenase medium subunit
MYGFDYHRPGSVADAASALGGADDGKYLAGGQTLLATMKQRLASPSDLVDLGGIADLKGITVSGGSVSIGAMTTHAEVAASADVQGAIPALAAMAGDIGDRQVRNAGTIGGSLANNDPAADYPAAILALGATITTNKRQIAADDFIVGMFETALEEDEIITSVSFPAPTSAAYMKFKQPASRFALVGVFVAKTAGGVRVAVTGATSQAHRGPKLEAALNENFSASAVDGVQIPVDHMNVDIHAGAEYRANLVKVMAKRAIEACG